ncbi:hypothetical protein [Streptomyces sp. TS71-3]|uniref:hypothetical protein n=1 Tax=Streptomyces sp. TS71-3 TaxID=2733862 RepID=UPI001BB33099|nr:hypothetical protein [Streptomyces sp. TS71-3]
MRNLPSTKKGGWILATGLACALAGLTGLGTSAAADSASSASQASSLSGTAASAPTGATKPPTGGGGPAAGPSDGGATGIVESTSASGFTMTTATGVVVTVDETSATAYDKNTHRVPARSVRKGASVLALGVVDSTTITAARVIVQPGGDGGAAAAGAAGVIPFQQGTPSPVKTHGQVPSDYTEGDGTIVSGETAYEATRAAQAVVPGGVVDRVVELSDGEYEVHNISVNWPHHVFVGKDFKVLGWE